MSGAADSLATGASAARATGGREETPAASTRLDEESRGWVARLRPGAPDRERALRELHTLLVRAAGFEIARRRGRLPHLRGGDLDDLAQQCADDALVAILAKLDTYRGESRFTTWAYKFALLEAAVKLRRRAWQGRELPLEPERWFGFGTSAPGPGQSAEGNELLQRIRDAIDSELTPHQREVLLAVAMGDVPIDVLAERLSTTRGALYKTIHDARRKLRAHLARAGFELEERAKEAGDG